MNNCIVIVPIYKDNLDIYETQSLNQLFKILNPEKYSLGILCKKSLFNNKNSFIYNYWFKESYVYDDHFFESRDTYSRLLLQEIFYNVIKNDGYDSILIYQLDGWIFKDELNYWVNKGYDYIGAPYALNFKFARYNELIKNGKVLYNGNGGMSLRNIDSFIYNTHKYKNLISTALDKGLGEDYIISKYFEFNNYPSFSECAKFSWEDFPYILYLMNNQEPPFLCHKYNSSFYVDFYKEFNLIDIPVV